MLPEANLNSTLMNRVQSHTRAVSCHQASTVLVQRIKLKTCSVPNATAVTEQIQSYFSEIEDPRVQRTRAHLLVDILIIGILAVIAGGKGVEDMENYGLSKLIG